MSNRYILYMSKETITAPMDKNELVAIARKWDAQMYTSHEQARKCATPLVTFYGMTRTDVDINEALRRYGAGAVALVATSATRNLYILKIDDHYQTLARHMVGK